VKPGAGLEPVPLGGLARDAQDGARLVFGVAAEKAQLDNASEALIHGLEPGQCVVELDELFVALPERIEILQQRVDLPGAALGCEAAAGMVDQDMPHRDGRR